MRHFLLQLCSCLFFFYSSSLYSQENNLDWVGCGISKKSYMTKLAQAYSKRNNIVINLQGGGATRGIRDISNLDADFGGSCRYHLPENQLEKKVGFEPVAWDALVLITHPDNPINNLSLDQVKKIYIGNITNWKDVGGSDAKINLLTRQGKISGVGYSIRSLIFSDINKEFPISTKLKSSGPVEKAVESDINAFAITGISSAQLRKVKILSLNNKLPDYESIKSGKYVLYRPLYITYNPRSPNLRQIKDFIRFAHSKTGRDIMVNNGVVPYIDALRLVMIQSRASLVSQNQSKSNITY